MAVQQQIAQEQTWEPSYDNEQTRRLISLYQKSPTRFKEDQLNQIREHAQYHNVPFYEGEFSVLEAVQQAGAGLLEGFTTLRTGDHPDNEYEAIARNIGHLVGFVPGIAATPLKALGLVKSARALAGLKSVPMKAADFVTKQAKKIVRPVIKSSQNSRYGAVDTASKFLMKDKGEVAKHLVEGAFHLGTASAVSSVWDGVDQMMNSFVGGAAAGGVFRTIGNVIPGTTKGDKIIKGLAGSMFMGIPQTMRGATTPEQIYEYLAGAYFGANERPWLAHKTNKAMKSFEKQANKDPKLEWERNPEEMEGWSELHPLVQSEMKAKVKEIYKSPEENRGIAYNLMKELGIVDKIPAEELTTKGYGALSNIRKGMQKASKRKKAHEVLGVAASGGSKGADAYWSMQLEKFGLPVIHFMPETNRSKSFITDYFSMKKKGITTGIDRGLSESELFEAGPKIERANQTLKRDLTNTNTDFLARNWFQVKNANAIYAIGEIEYANMGEQASLNGRSIKGGTGFTIQMGIDKGIRNIFTFDPKQKEWFMWDYSKNRFSKIKEAPKLQRNSAVVGTRGDIKYKDTNTGRIIQKLSPESKQAIKNVVQKTFGDLPIKKSKSPEAKSQESLSSHTKTISQIRRFTKEIEDVQKQLDEINLDLKEGKIPRSLRKTLKEDVAKFEDFIKERKERIETVRKLEETDYFDFETGEIINDVDTGMKATAGNALMKKSEQFSTNYLKEIWDAKDQDLMSKRNLMLESGKKVEDIIRKYTEPGEKNVKWEDAVIQLEKDLKLKKGLSENGQRQVKKWLTEQNLGKQVIFVKTNKKELGFTDPKRPTSSGGKTLKQVEPPKLIEELYEIEGGKYEKGVTAPLVVLESVYRINKKGFGVDVPLNKLVNFYRFSSSEKKIKEDAAKIMADNTKAKIIKEMAEKHNMYPMGGQGDKGRINFVKYHPKSKKEVKKNYLEVVKNLRKVDKKALTLLKNDMKEAKKMGLSEKDFKKMVVSNMMYDLNLNGFNYSPENMQKVIGKGFIPGAIAYNKRAQIWMTNGYSGNKEFVKNMVNDLSREGNYKYVLISDPEKPKGLSSLKAMNIQLPEHVDGAILVRQGVVDTINLDAAHPKSGQNKSFIIDNTPEIIRNSDGKIIQKINNGALLGKYMMHTVGKDASAEMRKKGIHMMIMTSSAKQTGLRKVGDYEVGKNGELNLKGTKTYELDPGSVKYNSSVINDSHMAQKQIWVKQLFTNLHQFGHSPISSKMIENIHEETIQKAFDGNAKMNAKLKDYISTLDNKKIEDLIRNLEDIGTNELISALKTPGAARFSEMAMQKMLRIVEKDVEAQFQDGEINAEQRGQALQNLRDSISPIDRLLKNVAIVGEQAASQGKAGFSGYLHKHVRDYRAAVLHNYFVKSITRPSADNSAVARIRPFDKWMQKDFKDLNKRDDIFYLDEAYRDTQVKLPNGKTEKLGRLWDSKNPVHKDIFSALVLRVPMDSISGAHKLKFKGFTGREGHGIMMHGRSMRALGGADLDGDEAFIYFGGKNENGTGYGMKQSWINAIHKNKGEFYTDTGVKGMKPNAKEVLFAEKLIRSIPNFESKFQEILEKGNIEWLPGYLGLKTNNSGDIAKIVHAMNNKKLWKPIYKKENIKEDDITANPNDLAMVKGAKKPIAYKFIGPERDVADNKGATIQEGPYKGMTFRELLTEGAGDSNPLKSSKALYYSPISRLKASEGAVTGRDLLGTIVSQAQTMKSTYNTLMDTNGKKEEMYYSIARKNKNGKWTRDMYRVTREPKAPSKYQRELTRAQIAFGSDPLDEAGLKSPEVFFRTLHDAYFKTKYEVKRNNKGKFTSNLDKKELSNIGSTFYLKGGEDGKGILGQYRKMNSAYFSRNFAEGRRWTMDEVNDMASGVARLTEAQKNTMLPKIASTLEGLDWSDNLFNRLDLNMTRNVYKEVNKMVEQYEWLKPYMARASFKVPYNDQVDVVLVNNLQNRFVRRELADDTSINGYKKMINIINKTPWKKEIDNKEGGYRQEFLNNRDYRFKLLGDIVRQSEDFISNDLADMATLLNIKRILGKHKINGKKIEEIHARTETFKQKSYMSIKERRDLDTGAELDPQKQKVLDFYELMESKYPENIKPVPGTKKKKRDPQDLIGDKRSASWDQMKLDAEIFKYKSKLKSGERELFDHLMLGTLNRGRIKVIYDLLEKQSKDKFNPMLRGAITNLIKEASGTKQGRLGINSEEVSDTAIQNHFRAMNDVYGKMWEQPTEDNIKNKSKKVEKEVEDAGIVNENLIDKLVQGGVNNEGYAGIKPYEVTNKDKKTIISIATSLKKYNNKMQNIPDLNEQIRGILYEATGKAKDLNALHRQDFEMIDKYLKETENGTIFQRIWKNANPEIQKRYYSLFPDTINRELMAYDIKWLRKEGWFQAADGTIKKGLIRRPTYYMDILQNWIHKSNSLAQSKAEVLSKEIETDFLNLTEHKEGNGLFKIAVAQREQGIRRVIDQQLKRGEITEGEAKAAKITYLNLKSKTEKDFNWNKLQDKEFTITNDTGNRIRATGKEIIDGSSVKELTGVKEKLTKRFESMHKIIRGDEKVFNKYTTGEYFDPKTKTQPKMNWKLFIKHAERSFEKGDELGMELGIDGMRHIMRSMMHDLGARGNNYNKWVFKPTGQYDFSTYWPHMFFDKGAAKRSMDRALKKIQEDSTLSPSEKDKALQEVVMRHKSLTGEWMFGDMGDWEKVDIFEMKEALQGVAAKRAKKQDIIKFADMRVSTGSLSQRKGHVEGWSTDMNVMDAYVKNVVSTYYRQLNQIVGRNTIAEAKGRMTKKFGKDLANRWENFFKLYVQGAMGQPDVIPDYIYNDSKMKIQGTPYAWFADNKVLNRINKIREKLGVKESDLPKELKEFTYQDIRNWSNMEAKFELMALLSHPKSAITNLFGGSLHTIQSAGPNALMKARSIKWLKRINPNWNSMEDVSAFVVKKGVIPEFMIHELGLGKDAKTLKSIESFIGDLTTSINSKDPIARKKIFELGKKHGIMDFLIEMAKKGVKATQFLYEAPQRPMFARTALGKVMSRFQLYAWNSVRFRNDIRRQASAYGFKEGTESYEKFKRLITIDMFVMALGSMFMYSLFDNAMPQPYSWMQDTANWVFGDEKERERAFYGTYPTAIAPLQAISAPITRIPMAAIMAYASGDWEKLTDYQIYTLFPFGRIIRDVAQPGRGLIDNPSRLVEKMVGLPLQDVSRFRGKQKDEIEEGTRYKQPKPSPF